MILVVGDLLQDVDEFYSVVKSRDGYPVLRLERTETRPGGAGAVAQMVKALGRDYILACDFERVSVKRRIITDKVVARIDQDIHGQPPKDLPPADLCLIADYAKGAVTHDLCRKISKRYKHVIADWHPSRPADFYCGATLKSSWGPAFIRTMGSQGIEWNGERFHSPCEVVDPCGAGDMVLASLGVSRLDGLDWREACELAAKRAAQVCGHWGAFAGVLGAHDEAHHEAHDGAGRLCG